MALLIEINSEILEFKSDPLINTTFLGPVPDNATQLVIGNVAETVADPFLAVKASPLFVSI
jgi:hypothetical protein